MLMIVFFIGGCFQPYHSALVHIWIDRHELNIAVRCSSVPVMDPRRALGNISFGKYLLWLALFLIVSDSAYYNQYLPSRMIVPLCSRTLLISYTGKLCCVNAVRRHDPMNPGSTCREVRTCNRISLWKYPGWIGSLSHLLLLIC